MDIPYAPPHGKRMSGTCTPVLGYYGRVREVPQHELSVVVMWCVALALATIIFIVFIPQFFLLH